MRKRVLSLCCAAAILISGCGPALSNKPAGNEIVTMQPVPTDRLTVTIRAEYNVSNESIRSALQAQFPDVSFVSVFHCSPETQYELRQSLQGADAEDLVISPNMKSVSDIAPQYLLDLSGESFAANYTGLSLENCQIGGKLYYLPGPSSLYGIVYDKTLFREKGWQVPHGYSEFLKLVSEIEKTGIRAIQPTCRYARQAQLVLTMFDYADVFGGVENTKWLRDYQNGSAEMKGHIEPALARYAELNRAGVIRPEDFDMQPGNRSSMLYSEHSCAMIIENEQAQLYAKQAKSDHQYGMFPFWCGDGENADYLMSIPSYYCGVSAALGKKGNEKKKQKVMEIMQWISTPEGQTALNGGELLQISNVQNTPYADSDFNADIAATVRKGNLVPETELMASGNNNPVEKALKDDLRKYLEGTMQAEEIPGSCDAVRDQTLSAGIDRGEKVGSAAKSFTRLETGLYIADVLKRKADADIGLCFMGNTHCGTVGRIYQGDIYRADISSLSLSIGVVSKDPNDKKLWLVGMTGAQLKDLLKKGCQFQPNDNVPNIPYYVASGLKIRFAPWKEDKLVSVTLANGSSLEDGKTYRVALWGWPFAEPCEGTVEKVFEESSGDILSEAVSRDGALKPFRDRRFVLVY